MDNDYLNEQKHYDRSLTSMIICKVGFGTGKSIRTSECSIVTINGYSLWMTSPKDHVIALRNDIRASSVTSSVKQVEQHSDLITFTVAGADKSIENEELFIIPIQDETIKNLQTVAAGGGGIQAVMVSHDYSEVYGVEIFKDFLAKVTLQRKINYILSLQNA